MKKKEETVTFTTRISLSTYTQIALLAERENRSMNNMVNKILTEYLDKKCKK